MKNRPNVVLFISDQQRADTLPGISPVNVRSPHVAWLAQQGAQFEQAFCTLPICCPARASILSGLFPHQTGVVANYQSKLPQRNFPDDAALIADYLRPSGYQCAYTGKWHLPTGSDRRGFKDFVSRIGIQDVDDMADDDAARFARKLGIEVEGGYHEYLTRQKRNLGDPDNPVCGRTTKLPLAFHPSTLQAQQAAHFIRTMQTDDNPFLLVYSCIEPHPMGSNYDIAPCPFDKMYDPQEMYLPQTLRDSGVLSIMRSRNRGNKMTPADFFTDDHVRAKIAGYYGAVSYVDHLLGIILEALISSDQLDDTLVIFTSDHGEMLGDHRMFQKGSIMFEQMIRVPLVIKPPRAASDAAGVRVQHLVSHADLVPTMLRCCGQDVPGQLPGFDLGALVAGQDKPVRDGVAVEYYARFLEGDHNPLRAWRTRSWKYVETINGVNELYNLEQDPLETRNLINSDGASSQKAKMKEDLYAWIKSSGDPWPDIVVPDVPISKIGPWVDLADAETKNV